MTGPEHYKEAERLAGPSTVTVIPTGETRQGPPTTDMILQALAHATLALAAATALAQRDAGRAVDIKDWVEAAGAPAPKMGPPV